MNSVSSLVFPSSFGYRFTPAVGENERYILENLLPMEGCPTIEARIKPLVRVKWFPSHALLKQGLIFIVGVTTHGISHPVHRGGYSAWCASTVIQTGMRPTHEEAVSNLQFLEKFFLEAVASNAISPEFNLAFQESVTSLVEKDEYSKVVSSLSKEVKDKNHISCINKKIHSFLSGLRKNQ